MRLGSLTDLARHVHFIEDRATMLERVVDAVQSATGSAWVAAYTPDAPGTFVRSAAAGEIPFGSPDAAERDDPALVALRASLAPLDGPEESVLAGALVLPFVAAGGIAGFLALGPAEEEFSAADEQTLVDLAGAVGIALGVLESQALRREVEQWRERAEWAERELAVLHRVLDRLPLTP
jgi:hypothetical protein